MNHNTVPYYVYYIILLNLVGKTCKTFLIKIFPVLLLCQLTIFKIIETDASNVFHSESVFFRGRFGYIGLKFKWQTQQSTHHCISPDREVSPFFSSLFNFRDGCLKMSRCPSCKCIDRYKRDSVPYILQPRNPCPFAVTRD